MASEIQTIAVIGAGDDGRTLTYAALRAGYRTILEDVSVARLEQAVTWISKADAEAGTRLGLPRSIEEAVRAADLIIEAVADEMEMKIELFTIFDKFAKPHAIFTSTSRLIPIADLAAVTFRPSAASVSAFFLPRDDSMRSSWCPARKAPKRLLRPAEKFSGG